MNWRKVDGEWRRAKGRCAAISNGRGHTSGITQEAAAFTLLEVVIALTIFFIAIFSILDLTGRCLRSARALQHLTVDATGVASALTLTNRLTEGALPSDLIGQFEELHPGFSCDGEIYQVGSNGLFQIDLAVISTERKGHIESQMSLLLYRPDSAPPGRNLSAGGRR